jgi:hypothetical protein
MSSGGPPTLLDDAPGSLRELRKLEAGNPKLRSAMEADYSVSHRFDMPYLAGYSRDRSRYYFDRHLPLIAHIKDTKGQPKTIHITKFYLRHEIVESALQHVLRLDHEKAHHLATAAEYDEVKQAGVDLSSYRRWSAKWIKATDIQDSKIVNLRIPPDFDTTPLEVDKSHEGKALLEKVREAMSTTRRSARSWGKQRSEAAE